MNTIRTFKAALAVAVLAGATFAQAAPYDVNGTLTGFSATPGTISATFNPTNPTFTGNWNVDTSSLVGDSTFAAYSVQWNVLGFPVPAGTSNYTSDSYHLDASGAAVSYNAASRTLTVTNGSLVSTTAASDYNCSGAALFCGDAAPAFQLNLTLTFADDALSAFSGTATASNNDGQGSIYSYDWSFNGQAPEVPVPAAVWLFGSSLIGLAGVARSRKS
jgi:hypothetical protein